MKRSHVAILALIVGVFVLFTLNPVTFLRRSEFRGEIRMLHETLEPGMTRQQVRAAIDSGRFPHLRFHTDDERSWLAYAPLEFGAQNWVLLIEFENDRVSALRVRTEDSFKYHPSQAPRDKERLRARVRATAASADCARTVPARNPRRPTSANATHRVRELMIDASD